MPRLLPIRAIRYAASDRGEGAAADISTLIAPPYDVLDEGPKQRLLADDPHNIVAVDLPVTPPKTLGPDEAYAAAGQTFRRWLHEGVLRRDDAPALFAYEQVYRLGDREHRRRGLFAALEVEPFNRPGGGIFRHEHTIRGGTDDRLMLMHATTAQLSPVFGVFDDPAASINALLRPYFENHPPDFRGITAHDRVDHRCWTVTDRQTIDALAAALGPTDVFIADGHHRYTTALNYAQQHTDSPDARACLFVLVPMQDEGLAVLPTHRVLCGLRDFSAQRLLDVIDADGRFDIRPTHHGADGAPRMPADLPGLGHHAVGLYEPAGRKTYAVATRDPDPLAPLLPDKPEVWRRLTVAVFHELLVDRALRPHFGGDAITYKYPHEPPDAISLTHAAPGRLGVLMQPTPLRSVCEIARAGEVMPPKTTFFHPKLATGLVINPLDQTTNA